LEAVVIPKPIRIAAIDDHPAFCAGIGHIFEFYPGVEVMCLARSFEEFQAAGADPDVVLLDLYLSDGPPALNVIADLREKCHVLVISAFSRPADVRRAVKAGAGGYLTKQADRDTYAAAVSEVAGGGFYVSSQLADILAADVDRRELTPRETQVLRYIAEGFSYQQTARRIGVAPATVATHLKRIRAKLGPVNAAGLGRMAVELGVFDDPMTQPGRA
jgi:DNA-binding NarL/FixJ family response regulator